MLRSQETGTVQASSEKCKCHHSVFTFDDTALANAKNYSRPVPHRNLKKFLSPAFTVSSVDKLDTFFKACVSTLLNNYYTEVDKAIAQDPKSNPNGNIETDFMRDLHCLALD